MVMHVGRKSYDFCSYLPNHDFSARDDTTKCQQTFMGDVASSQENGVQIRKTRKTK